MSKYDYKSAGVDIEAGNDAVKRIKNSVEATFSPQVLTGVGSFGSMFDLKPLMSKYQHPVLVQSIDGVGTKMIIARMMDCYDTVGMDLVSATANDIIVLGAKPLTLLDYIATDKIHPAVIEKIVKGMASACKENGISLVGGETAEMPDTYLKKEYDLVGAVTGVVDKDKIVSGKEISPGDILLGFASNGLHTNGYSLARKLFFDVGGYQVDSYIGDLQLTVGESLLKTHLNYTRPIQHLLQSGISIKGMAHISGGGLLENVPRILPVSCSAEIIKSKCPRLPIFDLLNQIGKLNEMELYRTFNMGIGLVMVVAPEVVSDLHQKLSTYPDFSVHEIGHITQGKPSVRLM